MAILITFEVGADDTWLRSLIRADGKHPAMAKRQQLVCEDREQDYYVSRLATLKHQRGKVYGGSLRQRWTHGD